MYIHILYNCDSCNREKPKTNPSISITRIKYFNEILAKTKLKLKKNLKYFNEILTENIFCL